MIRQSISIPPGAVTTVGPPHIVTEQDAATSPFDPAPEGGAAKGVEVQLVQNPGDIAAYLILQGSNFLAKTGLRSEEHTSELQSLMRISYAVFCLKKKTHTKHHQTQELSYHQRYQQNMSHTPIHHHNT